MSDTQDDQAPEIPVNSVIGQFQQLRTDLANQKTLDLDVPGYSGHLVIRYKAISEKELELIGKQAAKGADEGGLKFAADLIIRTCDEILVRQEYGSPLEPLQPGVKTTFSSGTLGELLGIEVGTAREEVFAVFSPDGSQPLAAATHGTAVTSWLQGNYEEIDKQLLGE